MVNLKIVLDERPYTPSVTFIKCLKDEPGALAFFKTLSKSHQNYFSKWIDSAKTDVTKEKRIVQAVNALAHGLNYAEMLREKSITN